MRISIYIVDDEYMAIQYFKKLLDKTGIEYSFAGHAQNGVKALPEILRIKPDVVFADISMPMMDGLELTEKIHEQNPDQRVILLTAYKSFEYAKAGLKAGVLDYVVKNELNESILRQILSDTQDVLNEDRKKQSLIKQRNYKQFLLSKDISANDSVITPDNKRIVIVSIAHRLEIWLHHWEVKPVSVPLNTYEMENLEYPAGVKCQSIVEMADKEYAGIFYLEERVQDDRYAMKEAVSVLERYLRNNSDVVWCFVISKATFHPLNLPGLYREAFEMQKWIYSKPDHSVYFSEDVLKSTDERLIEIEDNIFHFREHLQAGDKEKSRMLLAQSFKEGKAGRNFWDYSESLIRFLSHMKEFSRKHRINMDSYEIDNLYVYPEMAEKVLLGYFDRMFDLYSETRDRQYSRYTKSAIAYIQKNFASDISISDLAEEADISEGHLRKCFKQETGEKIVDYIMNYRIEQAKLMIQRGERILDNVWKQSGFTSAQYFSFAFKKKEGISPREYMKRNQ
ncbi:MAG: response regulator [Lachnospiraceae bacterium]|nr:response regulator [Lachnospiraceae bacterium]